MKGDNKPQLRKQNATVGLNSNATKLKLPRQDATLGQNIREEQPRNKPFEAELTEQKPQVKPQLKRKHLTLTVQQEVVIPPVTPQKKPALKRVRDITPAFGENPKKSITEIRKTWGLGENSTRSGHEVRKALSFGEKILTKDDLDKINNPKKYNLPKSTHEQVIALKQKADRDWASEILPSAKKDSESTDLESESEERASKRQRVGEIQQNSKGR